MRVFVTGGDGLLGSNLVRVLLDRGYDIKVLVQPGRPANTLDNLPVSLVEGDLLARDQLLDAAEGCDAIIHAAANTSIWPPRSPYVRQVNIEGTKNILRVAESLNVEKLVYIGTANSFSFGTRENPGHEDTPYIAGKYGLDYMDSKFEAHQLVIKAASEGLQAVVVNPTFMLGPFDSKPSSGALLIAIYNGTIPFCAPGGRNYICVKDAAVGVANALERGTSGESYIIGNTNLTYKEVFNIMGDVMGVRVPRATMPKSLIVSYGRLSSTMHRLLGITPKVSVEMAKISCDNHFFTAKKAVQELDLPQSPIEEGILECYDWFRTNGYIRK